ncbi:MAG: molybdenum cofactor biosynthesis protein MoaE [Pseudomonadota bacterium]
MEIRVTPEAFEPGAVLTRFSAGLSGAGAVVSFSGVVRPDDGLTALEIEHYPAMTEAAIRKHADDAMARFKLLDVLVIHRHGRLYPGDTIMMVAAAAAHRRAAFDAADFLMDYLKSRAPFWKKEISATGEIWVVAKDEDEAALRRW